MDASSCQQPSLSIMEIHRFEATSDSEQYAVLNERYEDKNVK